MIDPDIARFVAASEGFYPPQAAAQPIAAQRRLYDDYARAFAVAVPAGVTVEGGALARAGRTIPLRLYRPRRVTGEGVVAYAHGGGFMLGSLDSHHGIVARVADAVGLPVVSIDYRLAPEHRFAAARADVLDATTALLEGRSPWPDLPTSAVGLMGDSAGGTLACAAALELGRAWPGRLRALALVYPVLGFEPAEPARTRWAEAPMLTLADVRFYRSAALGDDPARPAFPLEADDLASLPPTVLLPADVDPLRDDCTVLAGRLRRIGRDVMLLPGTGLVHGALRALDHAPAMAVPFAELCGFLRQRLTVRTR